jgi:hypothetical protein
VNDEDAMREHCNSGDNGEEPYGFGIVNSTEFVSVRFLEKSGGAAVLSFKSEKRATVAAKALDNAPDDGAAEILRSTLWPDELSLFDPGNTKLRVAGVPPAIDENAMLSVFSTYGVVRRVAMDSEPNESELRRVCSVTMADRAGAETAAAALSGVYRFEETQEKPVAVTWCGLTPEYAGGREEESETEPPAAGKKRKRDGDETDAADVDEKTSSPTQKNSRQLPRISTRQLALVGLPEGVSEQDVAQMFDQEANVSCFVTLFAETGARRSSRSPTPPSPRARSRRTAPRGRFALRARRFR